MSSETADARSRVETSTIFEELLLHEHITPPQLQAARQFSEDLATGGALGFTDSLESPMETADYDNALRATLGSMALCDRGDTRCFIEAVTGQWTVLPSYITLEEFGGVVSHCLQCLVHHYGLDRGGQEDPRAILRRQVRIG